MKKQALQGEQWKVVLKQVGVVGLETLVELIELIELIELMEERILKTKREEEGEEA